MRCQSLAGWISTDDVRRARKTFCVRAAGRRSPITKLAHLAAQQVFGRRSLSNVHGVSEAVSFAYVQVALSCIEPELNGIWKRGVGRSRLAPCMSSSTGRSRSPPVLQLVNRVLFLSSPPAPSSYTSRSVDYGGFIFITAWAGRTGWTATGVFFWTTYDRLWPGAHSGTPLGPRREVGWCGQGVLRNWDSTALACATLHHDPSCSAGSTQRWPNRAYLAPEQRPHTGLALWCLRHGTLMIDHTTAFGTTSHPSMHESPIPSADRVLPVLCPGSTCL